MGRYPFEFRPLVCQERNCDMEMVQDFPYGPVRYFHGDNPEATLEVSRIYMGVVRHSTVKEWTTVDCGDLMPPSALEDWVERVHAYGDGDVLTTPTGEQG